MTRRSGRGAPKAIAQDAAALDVSALPSYTFGTRAAMWWGTAGVIAIEGMAFALTVASYFYLRSQATTWPLGVPPPDLLWGGVNLVLMLASVFPNHWTYRAAKAHDLGQVRAAMVVCILFAVAFLVFRVFEFRSLNVGWDTNAYGSIVWLLMGLHTVHLITDLVDTVVLAVLMFTGPIEGRRFADVSDNAFYWYFVVLAWVPLYLVVYWAPRW
jgi:cytochrome c oxidase subunit III